MNADVHLSNASTPACGVFAFQDFEIDESVFELRKSGRLVQVQPKVLELLLYLIRSRDRLVSKGELLASVWPDVTVGKSSLTQAIMLVRRALDDVDADDPIVQTVRGRGYRFVATVTTRDRGPSLRPPAPSILVESARAAFAGRRAEITTFDAALRAASSGAGELLLVTGEPGVGKTWLAEELVRRAREAGAEVLVGRCHDGAGAPPFWPWVQIVRAVIARDGAHTSDALLGDVLTLVPELSASFGVEARPQPADHTRFRLFDSVTRLLLRAARGRPLVLVLDDLHLADRSSLELLDFLAREAESAPVLLLALCRDAAFGRRDAGLPRRSHRTLRLQPLTRLETTELAAAVTGRPPSPDDLEALMEKTGGNPLLVTQLLLATQAVGVGEGSDRDERASVSAALARGGFGRVIARCYFDDVPQGTRDALEAAAVLGTRFALPALAAMLGQRAGEILELLASAQSCVRACESSSEYAFAHGIVRDVLYGELEPARRARLHAAAGEALLGHYGARLDAHLAEVAHHFVQSAPTCGEGRAVELSLRAARHAAARGGYASAAEHYEDALRVMDLAIQDHSARLPTLVLLGEARRGAGQLDASRAAFEAAAMTARACGEHEVFARAALAYAAENESGAVDPTRIALLEEAHASKKALRPATAALVMARLATALYFSERRSRGLELSGLAVAAARAAGDACVLGTALRARRLARWEPDGLEERACITEELFVLADESGDLELLAEARMARIEDLLETGDIFGVDVTLSALERLAEAMGQPLYRWYVLLYRAMRALLDGDHPAADRLIGEATSLAPRASDEVARSWLGVQRFALARVRDELEGVYPLLCELAADYPDVSLWRCAIAYVDCRRGDGDAARRALAWFVDRDLSRVRRDGAWMASVSLLAEVCAALGDAARAEVLYGALIPYTDRHVVLGLGIATRGPVTRYLGLLAATMGRVVDAEAHFTAAAIANGTVRAVPLRAPATMTAAPVGRDAPPARALYERTAGAAPRLPTPAREAATRDR